MRRNAIKVVDKTLSRGCLVGGFNSYNKCFSDFFQTKSFHPKHNPKHFTSHSIQLFHCFRRCTNEMQQQERCFPLVEPQSFWTHPKDRSTKFMSCVDFPVCFVKFGNLLLVSFAEKPSPNLASILEANIPKMTATEYKWRVIQQ